MVDAAVLLSVPRWQQIKWKKLWEGLSVGLVFAFYLSAPKWITPAPSCVWQAFRESQAETAGVKVWEQRHKHDLKFCQCCFSHRLTLTSPLSAAPSLPLAFTSLSCARCLSVCLSLPLPPSLPFLINTSFTFSLYRCRSQCSHSWFTGHRLYSSHTRSELLSMLIMILGARGDYSQYKCICFSFSIFCCCCYCYVILSSMFPPTVQKHEYWVHLCLHFS